MGSMNDSRPTDLNPSQGGKYQGFGSSQTEQQQQQQQSQQQEPDVIGDALGALSKGWSMFSGKAVELGK